MFQSERIADQALQHNIVVGNQNLCGHESVLC
jgi:hypothetical protein